jgi:UDP-N-acetyl-D-glucosamine dehydrogenase
MSLIERIQRREARVGVVGLGYVGLPLCLAFAKAGFKVLGFDIDPEKARKIAAGETYLKHIAAEEIRSSGLEATTDFSRARSCDALLLCVPTPLTPAREPDLSFITRTCESLQNYLRPGQLVVLESTTYPGTTAEVVRPIVGAQVLLAFSPEREDPGNARWSTAKIPKVLGADDEASRAAAQALYAAAVERVVVVSSTRAAELTKLLENIFRAVNIALVNELKLLCERMEIDVWEVIDAAATKPFGFMPFYPGPGLGGHCIPIDPFYLTWKAREFEFATRFIELAGEINTAMPAHVVTRLQDALNDRLSKPVRGSRVLVLGVAYKADVDDVRESPALHIIELLLSKGAQVRYHDPWIPQLPRTRKHSLDLRSVELTDEELDQADCVLVVAAHTGVDYRNVVARARLVVDTRHVCSGPNVVTA